MEGRLNARDVQVNLILDEYERDNLFLLLDQVRLGNTSPLWTFNTGDWVAQIWSKLGVDGANDRHANVPGIPLKEDDHTRSFRRGRD